MGGRDLSHHLVPSRVHISKKPEQELELGCEPKQIDMGCRCLKGSLTTVAGEELFL